MNKLNQEGIENARLARASRSRQDNDRSPSI